jgi:hypothetical protein
MAEMMDCLVNYFSIHADAEGIPYRFFSYHVVGGPGPTEDEGVATITALSAYKDDEKCEACESYFFTAKTGGPAAAINKALEFLEGYHAGERLRSVRTEIRRGRHAAEPLTGAHPEQEDNGIHLDRVAHPVAVD